MKTTPVFITVFLIFAVFASGQSFEEPKRFNVLFEDLRPLDSDHSIPCPAEFFFTHGEKAIIINTLSEYKDFVGNKVNCNAQKPPEIDFTKKVLLGRYVITGGCKAPVFDKEVIQDDEKKEIKYTITARQKGTCARLWGDMNWIAMPKVPKDYAAIIDVREFVESEPVSVSLD
jgi:hypothetical protein